MQCTKLYFIILLLINVNSQKNHVSGKLNDGGFHNLSNDFNGKFIPFNSGFSKEKLNADDPAWYGALRESSLIALGGDIKLRKNLKNAIFYGFLKSNLSNKFGDIVTLAKGKLRRINDETYAFHQTINDNEEEDSRSSQNVLALWMVEKIRHRLSQNSGYRFDLRFTIIPIDQKFNDTGRNLSDLRKRVFILRDIDYPEYFSSPPQFQQIKMRSDAYPINHSFQKFMSPHALNFGEYQKRSMIFPTKSHVIHQNRFPVRFPDSREVMTHQKQVYHIRHKKPQEFYQLDFRGATPEINKIHDEDLRKQYYQPAIAAVPMIAIPQMSLLHIPYTIPYQFHVPVSNNQRSLSTFSKNIPKNNPTENIGVNSIRVQKFSLPDQKLNDVTNNNTTKPSTKYSQKVNDENMDQSNDFRPIVSPVHYNRAFRGRTTTQSPISFNESSQYVKKNDTKKQPKRVYENNNKIKLTSSTTSSTTESIIEVTVKNYDVVATRPTSTTSERPILKWYPRKARNNKTLSIIVTTQPTIVETTPIISLKNTRFRGRNRFSPSNEFRREKNRNFTTTTEKSNALSSKWKAITTTTIEPIIEATKYTQHYATTLENESPTVTVKPIAIELISANVEEVKSNSSNVEIYKASAVEESSITSTESTTIFTENLN